MLDWWVVFFFPLVGLAGILFLVGPWGEFPRREARAEAPQGERSRAPAAPVQHAGAGVNASWRGLGTDLKQPE